MKEITIIIVCGLGLLAIGMFTLGEYVIEKMIAPRLIKWIATQSSLPFFQNGLAFTPKDSRHYRFSINEAFDKFFTFTPGYAYLYQVLPKDTAYPTESTKYFLVENAGTMEIANKIGEKLQTYGKYSIKLDLTDKRFMVKNQNNPTEHDLTPWQLFCWRWRIYWYGSFSGQETLSSKKITFATSDGTGKGIIWRPNEQSAVYFSCNFEYGFESDEAEDIDNVRLKITFTITGKFINPRVAEVENANVFERMYSMVQARSGQVVKMSSFHLLHENVKKLIDDQPEEYREKARKNTSSLHSVFQEKMLEMLNDPDNFIGVEWQQDSVNILQVEAVGEESKKLLQQIIDALAVQFENKIALDKATAANTIREANSETDKNVAIKKSESLKTVKINEAEADAAKLGIEITAAKDAMTLIEDNPEALALFKQMQAVIMSNGNVNNVIVANALKSIGSNGLSINTVNLAELFKPLINSQTP